MHPLKKTGLTPGLLRGSVPLRRLVFHALHFNLTNVAEGCLFGEAPNVGVVHRDALEAADDVVPKRDLARDVGEIHKTWNSK